MTIELKAPQTVFLVRALDLVSTIAGMTMDGDCVNCQKDGTDANPDCDDHEAWEMPIDDAYDTVHSLISKAREIVRQVEERGETNYTGRSF